MKISNKILWTIVALFISVLLPAILSAFFYVHIPGLVLVWLFGWLIWFLIFLWKLKSPDDKHPEVKLNGNWGGSDNDTYGLKSELAKVIAPNNFMKPYDPEKVTAAIELYNRLKTTDADDLLGLKEIRLASESSLGIRLDTDAFYNYLMDVFSPERYMEPYNKEKVSEMNRICTLLTQSKDNIGALEDILYNIAPKMEEKDKDDFNSELTPTKDPQSLVFVYFLSLLGVPIIWGISSSMQMN